MAQPLDIPAHANPAQHPSPHIAGDGEYWSGRFQAMASPCEILLDGVDQHRAEHALRAAIRETWRIERHLSRYVPGNPVDRLNHSAGQPVDVDDELARLLNYADQCYRLSEGRFDITSGVLRRVWRFDGSDALPASADVEALRPFMGWDKVRWAPPHLTLPVGMELDFGGIGKEYAVDRVLYQLIQQLGPDVAILVNFGGDLACSGPRHAGSAWQVGVEDYRAPHQAHQTLALHHGALATSGDTRRYLLKDGVRYSHILDPHTGWPVPHAPHSVTVAAPSCTLAGMLATFAMLSGAQAEAFLDAQDVRYWVQRDAR